MSVLHTLTVSVCVLPAQSVACLSTVCTPDVNSAAWCFCTIDKPSTSTDNVKSMKFCRSCSLTTFLFWLAVAEVEKLRFYRMQPNAASSPPIGSYRTEFARSAMQCVILSSLDAQCSGVWVQPIETRKFKCHFVNSFVNKSEESMYDFWQKVRDVLHL